MHNFMLMEMLISNIDFYPNAGNQIIQSFVINHISSTPLTIKSSIFKSLMIDERSGLISLGAAENKMVYARILLPYL